MTTHHHPAADPNGGTHAGGHGPMEPLEKLRARLDAAGHPAAVVVSSAEYAAAEDYLLACQGAARAAWQAAGRPDEWHEPLSVMFVGPGGGLMFKGVELLKEPEGKPHASGCVEHRVASLALWVCDCGRVRLEESGGRCDVGSDVPGGGAA